MWISDKRFDAFLDELERKLAAAVILATGKNSESRYMAVGESLAYRHAIKLAERLREDE